jgi:hypothetical protein
LAIAAAAGDLRVVLIHGEKGAPSTTQYTLVTPNGTRYALRSLPGRQWRTGMRVRVRGVKVAGLARNAVGPTATIVAVQDITVVSTPAPPRGMASTTSSAQLVGNAPSRMGVLFIIVTMCRQTASITPAVSWSCDYETVTAFVLL